MWCALRPAAVGSIRQTELFGARLAAGLRIKDGLKNKSTGFSRTRKSRGIGILSLILRRDAEATTRGKSYKLHPMRIIVNGQDYQTKAQTAAALLQELQTPQIGIALALNGQVVQRSQLQETTIPEGSNIEIVRAVQGG